MELDYQKINDYYIRNVDKFYRMHGGLSSCLLSYENETIELNIEISGRWTKDPRTTSIQISESWRSHCIELRNAKKYKVHLSYLSPVCDTGAVVSVPEDEDELDKLLEQLVKNLTNDRPPIYTVILEGLIDDDETADFKPCFMN